MDQRGAGDQLIVVAFDHFDDARTAMSTLRQLERDGRIAFEDTALLQVDPDGTAHVKDEVSGTTEKGAVIGALLGALLSFVLPVAGIVLGAAGGALVGRSMDTGVSGGLVDEVKRTIRPGRSALFLVVKRADADAAVAALRPYRGDVIQTTLSTELEDSLRQALGRPR
jgi:uncharacterized membrane protein